MNALRGDRGSATVAIIAVVVTAIAATAVLSAVALAHRTVIQAQRAADLSALAAADVVVGRASGEPCQAASDIAVANNTMLDSCVVLADNTTRIIVVRAARLPFAGYRQVEARARAGPADTELRRTDVVAADVGEEP